jgi:hypothetical protein
MAEEDGMKVADLLPVRLTLGPEAEAAMHGAAGGGGGARLAWDLIADQAGEALRGLLDCDPIELLAKAWLEAQALRDYADPAKHPPGETSLVPLAEHKFVRDLHPTLEVAVAGCPPARLRFTVSLAAHFKGLTLSIRDGHVTAGAVGEAWVSAIVRYGDVALTSEKESKKVKLPGRFAFAAPGLRIPPPDATGQEVAPGQ